MSLCSPETLTVGDTNNSFETATTAIITTVNLVNEPGHGSGSCQTSTQTVQILSTYISSQSTAEFLDGNNTDPSAEIQIDNVSADDAPYINTGDIYLEPSDGAIKGTAMTLNHAINTTGGCSGNTNEDHMVVDPFQTAMTATVTVHFSNRILGVESCASKTLTVALTKLYGGGTITGNPTNPITTNSGCIIPESDLLSWITCPVLTLLKNTASAVNDFIVDLLTFSVSQYFTPQTETVFNVFRNLGVAMLVIAALFMVISQAADLEIFAAHTVRKALPRIIVAAIAISLAWPLLQFFVGFFNDIGAWAGKIILDISSAVPAGQGGGGTSNFGTALGGVFDVILALLVGAAAFAVLDAGGLLSLLLSVILLIGVGIIVLVIRQIVILICILIAPIAIASYVLPGTEKLGKFWWDTLLATGLMFPIITAFLSAGAAMASITAANKIGWYAVLAVVFYIAPYIMLPMAFRIAGGLMERVASWAQGTHNQTIEGRLQGFRQNIAARNVQKIGAGSRYNPDSGWTRALGGNLVNRAGGRFGATVQGHLPWGRGNAATRANSAYMTADAAAKADTNFAAQMNNEEAMVSVAMGNDRNALSTLSYFQDTTVAPNGRTVGQNRLDSALTAGRTMKANQQTQIAAADALARSGKIIKNRTELGQLLTSVSHGNASIRAGVGGQYQYTSRQVGREDIGRNDDYSALQEMGMGEVMKQKPQSLENLYGPGEVNPITGRRADPPVISAIRRASTGVAANPATGAPAIPASPQEAQHFADVLFASQYNSSLSPQQQQNVQNAINGVNGYAIPSARVHPATIPDPATGRPIPNPLAGTPMTLMEAAQANYRDKFQPSSDRRLKTHIRHIQTLGNGIKLYSFRYIWGGPTYVGVMAQDLLQTHPEAVLTDDTGYYRVDYAILGLRMMELKEWRTSAHVNDAVTM